MKIPVKIKIINGVEYRYCGNHPDPEKVKPRYRVTLSYHQWLRDGDGLAEAFRTTQEWLKNAVLLGPEPTAVNTIKELRKMNLVSVWKPLTEPKS